MNAKHKKIVYGALLFIAAVLIVQSCACNAQVGSYTEVEIREAVMYGRDSCGFTVKMKEAMIREGVFDKFRYVDVTTSKGGAEFSATGATGVPHFVKGKESATGYMPPQELIEKLRM